MRQQSVSMLKIIPFLCKVRLCRTIKQLENRKKKQDDGQLKGAFKRERGEQM